MDVAQEMRKRVRFSDEALLRECEVHCYRASGPGGQKRNKTSSAVRLHHTPSGLICPAEESRSQHENKARALRRLREALVVRYRLPVSEAVALPDGVAAPGGVLKVGAKNPAVLEVIGLALDALVGHQGQLRGAAEALGVSVSSLTRFLAAHPKAWAEANRLRAVAGLAPLRAPG